MSQFKWRIDGLVVAVIVGLAFLVQTAPPLWFVNAVVVILVLIQLGVLGRAGNHTSTAKAEAYPALKSLQKRLDSPPIEPKRVQPKSAGGLDVERQVFFDFAEFADVFRWHLVTGQSRWRLQDTGVSGLSEPSAAKEAPCHGRCFHVYYNSVQLGLLEVEPAFKTDFMPGKKKYSSENPEVNTWIRLKHPVRLLSYAALQNFLEGVGFFTVGDDKRAELERTINATILQALWDTRPWSSNAGMESVAPDLPFLPDDFCIRFTGSAKTYLRQRQRYLGQGSPTNRLDP